MSDAVTRIARIEMPDGTPVWARISGADELEDPGGELSLTDVGFAERVEAQVESLQSLITGVARSLAVPLRAVRPDEVSVEFGIELTAKAGKVVGLLADGEAKAAITVTLTWNGGPPDPTTPANRTAIPGPTPAPTTTPAPTASPHPTPATPPPPGPPASAPHAGASPGAPAHGGATDPSGGGGA
ncbi:CU044_2847 family protein [Streptomyces aureus]|uniref:CU044_2847 family protein n=1 Tax=Streptomyces aureus TaxID=193461 RepID=UPI000567532D|nr:CU044_2847 family protein [Streptomyces aureus]